MLHYGSFRGQDWGVDGSVRKRGRDARPQREDKLMRLLLMDTCGLSGSVALADTLFSAPITATGILPGRSASERLIPVVRTLLEAQAWKLDELAAIVVVHGPGSFTGVRVGLSAAKGLSEATGVPLVAVSRLAVLAAGTGRQCSALDAGRGEFYFGAYRDGHADSEALLTRDELLEAVGQQVVIVCEERVAEALQGVIPIRQVTEPTASDALGIAIVRVELGHFDDAALLDANYLRRTDMLLFARPKVAVT